MSAWAQSLRAGLETQPLPLQLGGFVAVASVASALPLPTAAALNLLAGSLFGTALGTGAAVQRAETRLAHWSTLNC